MFVFWGLSWVMPSPSHLLKFARSRISHPLFHEITSASLLGPLASRELG